MRTAGIVLAAGSSRRLGRSKQLLPLGGKPLLAWPVNVLQAAGVSPIVLVLGYNAGQITHIVDTTGVQVVLNEHYAVGMSTSLHAGIDALPSEVDSVFLLTGDQPFIPQSHLKALLEAASATVSEIVATDYGEFQGVPMLLARAIWPHVREITGDQGARALLSRFPAKVCLAAAPDPAMALDVDTEEQYQAALHCWQRGLAWLGTWSPD